MATWFFLTLYVRVVRGQSPLHAGLLFLPLSLAVVGGSQLGFRVIARLDARWLFAAGGLLAAAGLWLLRRMSGDTALVRVIVPASLAMLGGGLMLAPVTLAAITGVPPEHGGLASGLLNTSRQIGGALGLAVLTTLSTTHDATDAGDRAAALSSGYAAALAIGAAIFAATDLSGALALPAQPAPPRAPEGPNQPRSRVPRTRPRCHRRR